MDVSMRSFKVSRSFLMLAVCFAKAPVARAELPPAAEKATNLNYDVEASLLFTDGLSRPRQDQIQPLVSAPAMATPSRGLGLGRLRIGATWQAVNSASLHVVLRPDAGNRAAEEPGGGEPRDIDTRAGDVFSGSPYRAEPTIRLLDAYQITVAPGSALSGSFGVFEDIVPSTESYPTLLGFGLETRLPAKFSGARLTWRRDSAPPDKSLGGLLLEMTVLQGDGDRAESRCEPSTVAPCGASKKSNDRGPVAKDPYQGAAVGLTWMTGAMSLGVMGGTYDAADVVASARRTEVFGKGGVGWHTNIGKRSLMVSLDLRYAKERWRSNNVDIRPRVQHSEYLSTAFTFLPGSAALLGFAVGHSDQNPATVMQSLLAQVPVNGYQVEVGYLATVGQGLSLQLMLTHERREMKNAVDEDVGAIYHPDGNRRTLRRMGLGLTYLLNDNA